MHVFISYAHLDREFVVWLAAELRQAGYVVWFDEALYGGQDWWQGILEAIETCDIFLLVVSGASLASIYCQAEYRYGLGLGKPLLPVMMHLLPLPDDLRHIQYVDLTRRERLPRLLDDLARSGVDTRRRPPARLAARRPALPESPLEKLKKQVEALRLGSASQAYQDQTVSALGKFISREYDSLLRKAAFDLLRELQQSPYISDYTARDIRDLLAPSMAHTYPTNLKSLVYRLLQGVKSNDPNEARQARRDLYRLLHHNPLLNESFEHEIYEALVFELVLLIREGSPAEAHAAREELLSILPPTRLNAALETEIYEVLIAEPRRRREVAWLRRVTAHPHFAGVVLPVGSRWRVWMGVLAVVVAVILGAAVLLGKSVASEPRASLPPLAVAADGTRLSLTWQDPDWLLLRFVAPQAELDLYDLTFFVEVSNLPRYYRLNQFRQLRQNPDFDIRRVPAGSCIVLGGVPDSTPVQFDGCSQLFYDGKGVPAVAAQPFWAAAVFSVRWNDAILRDEVLGICSGSNGACEVVLNP